MSHARSNDDRRCECGCGESLKYKRSDARFYSTACRTRAYRAEALRSAQIAEKALHNRYTTSAEAFWAGYRGIRRTDLRARRPR